MFSKVFAAAALVASVSAAAVPATGSLARRQAPSSFAASAVTGCFEDFYPNSRALSGASDYSTSQTIEKCNQFCFSKGFTYAGTEYYNECYCGNTLPTSTLPDSRCDLPCSGDANEICGGSNAISIQQLTPVYSTGCQVDDINYRSLNGATFRSDSMTVELCSSFCQARGFSLAGTEYANECYCGNELRLNGQATCDMACAGNPNEICGGGLALSVVSVDKADAPGNMQTYESFGCYTDYYPQFRALNGASLVAADMTTEKCAMYCQGTGAAYFGTEYANECYCGATLNPQNPSTGCDTPCAGNSAEICGGGNAISVYYYPSKVTPTNTASNATISRRSL